MQAVTVRRATSVDAAVLGRMLHDFNTEFETVSNGAVGFASRFTALLAREDQLALLAEQGGSPVGFAYLTLRQTPYYDGPVAQLEELYVSPGRRGQGIGSDLMAHAIGWARENRAGEMHINVDEEDTDTRRFYEQRFGFLNILPGTDYRMLFYEREL